MFRTPSVLEIIAIVLVVIFLFGPRRVGALARSIGKTFFQYKKTVNDIKRDLDVGAERKSEKDDPEKKA